MSISAETNELRAEHIHDWSNVTRTRDPFSAYNNSSYLQLSEKLKGTVLFRKPVPALSYIWISPNSKFVVGLSNVKLWNPYQIVVYSESGECLFKQDLVGMKLPGATESVTNYINWYKEPAPNIEIVENGRKATLLVEGPLGTFIRFEFPTPG